MGYIVFKIKDLKCNSKEYVRIYLNKINFYQQEMDFFVFINFGKCLDKYCLIFFKLLFCVFMRIVFLDFDILYILRL